MGRLNAKVGMKGEVRLDVPSAGLSALSLQTGGRHFTKGESFMVKAESTLHFCFKFTDGQTVNIRKDEYHEYFRLYKTRT
jgi:hypothetical protein